MSKTSVGVEPQYPYQSPTPPTVFVPEKKMSKASEQTPISPPFDWKCKECGGTRTTGHLKDCITPNFPSLMMPLPGPGPRSRRSSAKEFAVVVGRCLRALRELKSPVQQRLALEFIIDDLRLPKPELSPCNQPPLE